MKTSRLFLSGQTFSTFRNTTLATIAAGSALPIVVAAALAMGTTAANAVEILSFGQAIAGQDPVSATADSPASGETTISATSAEVTVDSCLGCGLLIRPQFLTLSAVSTGPASIVGGNVTQDYSGTFSITASGQNILSGTFTDAGIFGSGTSLTLSVSNATPGESLTFTSDVIPAVDLHNPEGMSLSFADVTPPASIVASGTLASATMSVSGTFSATVIPELSTWAMIALGFAGLGFVGFRQTRPTTPRSLA
jgi:hypothetical protein